MEVAGGAVCKLLPGCQAPTQIQLGIALLAASSVLSLASRLRVWQGPVYVWGLITCRSGPPATQRVEGASL